MSEASGSSDSNQMREEDGEGATAASVAPIDVPDHPNAIEDEDDAPKLSKAKKQKGKQAATPKRKRGNADNEKATSKGKRSWVWDHFDKYPEPLFAMVDGVKKEVGHTPRAKCKHCSNTFASDNVINGTSNLRKHIEMHCKKYVGSNEFEEDNQTVFTTYGELRKEWSQQGCVDAVTIMIVVDELPFSFIERPGCNHFCSYAIPRFEVPSRKVIAKNFLRMYDEKKQKMKLELKKQKMKLELKNHSICLTTDTWTSCQNINYMVITAHFIDDAWTMHKKILIFCLIPNHQGTTIGRIFEQCLVDWEIERVLTVSVDNALANEKAIQYLKKKMSRWNNPPIYGGQYMHVRCLTHIVNLIVRSGLSLMDRAVASIRNTVRYVRISSARTNTFKLCVEKEKVECKKICILDVPNRWNSTYLMLSTALELRKAFDRLAEEEEGKYRSYFMEDDGDCDEDEEEDETTIELKERKRVGPPTDADWEQAGIFVQFLSIFYEVTVRMSAQLKPTSPAAFHSIVSIKAELDDLFIKPITESSSPIDKILHDMTLKMQLKYKKYFKSVDEVNQLYLVALLLDPKYKLKNFEMTCEIMLGMNPSEVKQKSAEVKNLLQCLCDLYGTSHTCSTSSKMPTVSGESSMSTSLNKRGRKPGGSMLTGKMVAMLQKWGKDLEEGECVVVSHEVDRYLWDPMEKQVADEKFNILEWWKVNGEKYPSLQLVAKDVLAIQVSTVASESCFSTGKRVIDPYRSSLSPKSIEALICLQNWICSTAIIGLQYVPEMKDMEMIESLEKEIEREQREMVDEAAIPTASTGTTAAVPVVRNVLNPRPPKRKNPRSQIVLNP